MATLTPNAAAQMRPLALTITPGMDGARLAFVGGAEFDVVSAFTSVAEAHLASRQALATTANLMARLFPKAVA